MKPFDLEVWYGERVAVLGSNGSGKSHFLRLLAAGGTDPDVEHRPVGERRRSRRSSTPARPGSAPGSGPGWFVQTHEHPELVGRTLLEILHRGDAHRDGMPREPAARVCHSYAQRLELLLAGREYELRPSLRPACSCGTRRPALPVSRSMAPEI